MSNIVINIADKHCESNCPTVDNAVADDHNETSCDKCGKSFEDATTLESHRKTHSSKRRFRCEVCGETFRLSGALLNHCKTHTGEKPYKCSYCDKRFSRKGSARYHELIHTGKKPFVCSFCGRKFALKMNLRRHILAHSGEKPYGCDVCGKPIRTKESLDKHLRAHSKIKQKRVPKPKITKLNEGPTLTNISEDRGHQLDNVLSESNENIYNCVICGETFHMVSEFSDHLSTHTTKEVKCDNPEKPERSSEALQAKSQKNYVISESNSVKPVTSEMQSELTQQNNHVPLMRGKNFTVCHNETNSVKPETPSDLTQQNNHFVSMLSKNFSFLNNFTFRHSELNSSVKPKTRKNNCATSRCGRKSNINSFIIHHSEPSQAETSLQKASKLKAHKPKYALKQFSCDVCHNTCHGKSALVHHYRIHTGEKPFTCCFCGQRFSQSGNLQKHLRIHNGEKCFVCNFCEKKFSVKVSLEKHLLIHTGERPFTSDSSDENQYSCDVCGKTFKSENYLLRHCNIHTSKKKKLFTCTICNKNFARNTNLRIHLFTHTGEKRFVCSICGKKFTQSGSLRKHLLIHTGETPYACEFCDKGFRVRGNLHSHLKTHTKGERKTCTRRANTKSKPANTNTIEGKQHAESITLDLEKVNNMPQETHGEHSSNEDSSQSNNSFTKSEISTEPLESVKRNHAISTDNENGNLKNATIHSDSDNSLDEEIAMLRDESNAEIKAAEKNSHRENATIHHEEHKPYVCNKTVPNQEQLLLKNDKEFNSKCVISQAKTTSESKIYDTHSAEKKFVCNVCGKIFQLRHNLFLHRCKPGPIIL